MLQSAAVHLLIKKVNQYLESEDQLRTQIVVIIMMQLPIHPHPEIREACQRHPEVIKITK